MKREIVKPVSSDWYRRSIIAQEIYKEAGWEGIKELFGDGAFKSGFFGGLVGLALGMILSGLSPEEASQKTNVPLPEIEQAMMDEDMVSMVKQKIEQAKDSSVGIPSQQAKPSLDAFLEDAFKYIGEHEGLDLEVYPDTEGHPTIGIGHKIKSTEDFSNGITIEEAKALFEKDIQERLSVARSLFPQFDTYPNYVKSALLDGVYRGDYKREHKTTKHINDGNWEEASKEYLRNNDYYKSLKRGTGVAGRMEENSQKMAQYARELSQ